MSAEKESSEAPSGGYAIHGNIQTGAFGTGSSATVGAIGDRSRGWVIGSPNPEEQRLTAQLLGLLDELRAALEEHREAIEDDLFETVESNLDEVEESVGAATPAERLRPKLKTLQLLLAPFDTLVGLVVKLLELVQKSET